MRLEQIAPFPYPRVKDELARYPNAEVCWTQEEHRNQGAWSYVKERLDVLFENTKRAGHTRYIGRKVSGSTAVGSLNTHKQQHAELLDEAFRR